jgi:hypothetical protein
MFKKTKLKLTLWYSLILMAVTISFSTFVYLGVTRVTSRALEDQTKRFERRFQHLPSSPRFPNSEEDLQRPSKEIISPGRFYVDPQTIIDFRKRTLIILILINIAILGVSFILSYVLAGKTLKTN